MAIASQYVRGAKAPKMIQRSGAAQLFVTGEVGNPTPTSSYKTFTAPSKVTAAITTIYVTSVA